MPELRKDPINGRWVIISTERSKRPTDFKSEASSSGSTKKCPFCPGYEKSTPPEILSFREQGTQPNTPGWTLRVAPNKFPALRIEGGLDREGMGLYDKMNGIGAHEVIIETPNHDEQFSDFPENRIEDVLWAYRERILDLIRDPRFRYVLIFKNHGHAAGASLEHAHSQLIALPIVPKNVMEELKGAQDYYNYKERCVYCDIVRQEVKERARVVCENPDFLAIAPFASRFPFETWILPKNHGSCYESAPKHELNFLAKIFKETLMRLDRALNKQPFNFILHTAPLKDRDNSYYHWHFEITTRLTSVAGFERGSGFYINPTPPEDAAKFLREIRL
jgi:UDPglucose--hexose-1-phosphate uridylyltransferase